MNCFEWQSRSSDYLDGILVGTVREEAEAHLASCAACRGRSEHYRTILSSIGAQPRAGLPVALRKSPFAKSVSKLEMAAGSGTRSRWERAPWFVRTGIEGLAITALILVVVAMVPRLRAIYERNLQQRLDSFTLADIAQDDESSPLARGKLSASGAEQSPEGDDFMSEHEEEEETPAASSSDTSALGEIKVGNSEIWRFNLKTDSPRDLRTKVVGVLRNIGISSATTGGDGVEAPGGIQFDFLANKGQIAAVKQGLQKLSVPSAQSTAGESPVNDTFTWYKNKSRRQIPAGKARVVIWLSQL